MKIRGGAQLDMKVAGGSHGVLDIPGRARGHLQSWKKWSFPIPPVAEMDVGSADWVRVGKIRRIGRFSFADGEHVTRGVSSGEDLTTCAVELTEVAKGGERWWTLGFEACGPSWRHEGGDRDHGGDRVQRSPARRMGAGRIGLEVVRGVAPTLGSTSDADPVLNPPRTHLSCLRDDGAPVAAAFDSLSHADTRSEGNVTEPIDGFFDQLSDRGRGRSAQGRPDRCGLTCRTTGQPNAGS